MKHAILLQLLARLTGPTPLTVIDTHAGAGLYDLADAPARKSGEARDGIARLMAATDAPDAFALVIAAVRRCNPDGSLRWYPGSPILILAALRPGDRYVSCELRPDDAIALDAAAQPVARAGKVQARVARADGYGEAEAFLSTGRRGLVFVDPPFEASDDYSRIGHLAARARTRRDLSLAIWAPLKDLETFDALLRGLEAGGVLDAQVAEVRLRPLDDPMRMNGCALILVNAPDLAREARSICEWTAAELGGPAAKGQVFRL